LKRWYSPSWSRNFFILLDP